MTTLALVLSALALACCAALLWRDARRWRALDEAVGPEAIGMASRIGAAIRKHENRTAPVTRTSLAYTRTIIEAAERESAKARLIK